MSNPISKVIFSTRLMAILFLVFAAAMAAGTFIENSYNTDTARVYIYNTKWFEAIMIIFVINFMGNIAKYRLLRREKWAVLLLHLSFIFIIVGAGITRYFGDEGVMPIEEGETSEYYLSDKTYLTITVSGDINGKTMEKTLQDDFLFSEQADNFYANNHFKWNYEFNGEPIKVEYVDFINGAEEGFIPTEDGDEYLKIVESGGGSRHDHYLKNGENASIHNIIFSLNKPAKGAINIRTSDSAYTIESPFSGNYMRMRDQSKGDFIADSIQEIQFPTLFTTNAIQFALPERMVRGKYDIIPLAKDKVTKNSQDALMVKLTAGNETTNVKLLGGKGMNSEPVKVSLGGLDFLVSFGAITRQLPFKIKLNDFIAEKYPGTQNGYSSFMSKVTVDDDKPFDYDIYMNHILDYSGYRFFQSSFMPNEQGTILSVNHDYWGTHITYLGYFLLYAGLLGIMFYGKTRFKDLGISLQKIQEKRKKLISIVIIALSCYTGFAQHDHDVQKPTEKQILDNLHATTVSKEHAEKFGALIIQDDGGRMKPLNTFSSQLLRKLSKYDTYEDLNADQVMLSMIQNPDIWLHVPFIYIKKENDSLHHILGVPEKTKYVTAMDFFDEKGGYKLGPFLEDAYKASVPNQFQKEFKEVDLKLSLLERALSGEILKIYPVPNDENNKWISKRDLAANPEMVTDSLYANFIINSIPYYNNMLLEAKVNGNYSEADNLLEAIKKNQRNYGKDIMPSEDKVKAELLYNKYDIFKKLFSWYMIAGSLMFVLLIVQIFKDNKAIRIGINIFKYAILAFYILHTAGLITRWFISGHAPWSDAYESMIYVAWATMGIGLLFFKKSNITVASVAFVTSMVLMIAHWNWMDPEIANIRPVLNSYWLMIHVAVIVGSYGPFTLGFILGLVSLLLYIITTKKTQAKINLAIQEITVINELTLTVGVTMLTIGNFLGGQWANESWGRYWGWDPKETWALISIMIYAFVIHMRLVPGLRGRFAFNFGSIVAYASIMMTYFGVNFYLTGLHSYASGDKIITPAFIWYTVPTILLFALISYLRYRVNYKK